MDRFLIIFLPDKGGPKFKPILKAKGRPSVTPADVRTKLSAELPISMPPPVSIPEHTHSIASTPTLSFTTQVASSSHVIVPGSVPMPSRIMPSHPLRTTEESSRIAGKARTQETETGDTVETSDPPVESVTPRKRRRRGTTEETAGPEGTPEPIDPTQVKMSAICDDPGSGRVSSRWESSQKQYADARKRAREERARAITEADEEERESGRIGAKKRAQKPVLPSGGESAHAEGGESVIENTGQNADDFTYTESLKASNYAPQVRIGANGEVVLDMDSLQVDRAADPEFREETYSHVEESDQSKFTNNSSWSKRRIVRWGKEDTALFYDVRCCHASEVVT